MGRWWGRDQAGAIEFVCPPSTTKGHAVVFQGDGKATLGQVGAVAIENNAIRGEHLAGMDSLFFGSGFDGDAYFDGFSNAAGITPSSNAYTLTQDVNVGLLVAGEISGTVGVKIYTNGFRLIAQRLVLVGDIRIFAGANSASTTGGSVGCGTSGGAAGAAGAGGGSPGAGGAGKNSSPVLNALGGAGGSGGAGGASSGAGGPQAGGGAGSAGAASATKSPVHLVHHAQTLIDTSSSRGAKMMGGTGGGGGGGGGGNTASAGKNGTIGGVGGCVLVISCGTLDLTSIKTGVGSGGPGLYAQGGTGASGSAGASSAGGSGGSGGGGGGIVSLSFRQLVGPYPLQSYRASASADLELGVGTSCYISVSGGAAGGNGGGNGVAGTAGTAGTIIVLNMSSPYGGGTRPIPPSIVRPPSIRKRVAYFFFGDNNRP